MLAQDLDAETLFHQTRPPEASEPEEHAGGQAPGGPGRWTPRMQFGERHGEAGAGDTTGSEEGGSAGCSPGAEEAASAGNVVALGDPQRAGPGLVEPSRKASAKVRTAVRRPTSSDWYTVACRSRWGDQ